MTDIDRPEPGVRELLVRVHATTVNRTDCGYRAGKPWIIRLFAGLLAPKFAVVGTEFAGTVEAVGGGASRFARGDRVCGYNEKSFGAHAEFMTIHEDGSVMAMPPNLEFGEAAAGFEGSHYALANLRAAKVGAGSDVSVYGATGAIGSAAVQLAVALGANVTAVCRGEHDVLVAGLGAGRVIDYLTEDFTAGDATNDVVFDAIGKTAYSRCRPLVRPVGVFAATDVGPFPWNPLLALTTRLGGRRRVVFALPKSNREVMTYLRDRLASREFRPVVDRTYPLDDIVGAYRYVETEEKVGNVVICVA